ncbi:uncharacterized protein V1510DRAFT_417332 [Dipodascopsis tothii]|uniref:uncharacterized protein n=1 Tax=Dipodascopsis tothii TaxID=44089 RepID=UPI0034CD9C61
MATPDPSSATVVVERAPETEDDKNSLWSSTLLVTVSEPQKEQDGTQNAYVSYLVTTESDFPSFQQRVFRVRRRFSDFVYLYNTIVRDHPACAVPPLPDKQRLEYLTGGRFGSEFTSRRASSLGRFLARLANHPILRRAQTLAIFLESTEWNAYMRSRPYRAAAVESAGVFDGFSDALLNAFTKLAKDNNEFLVPRERADKLYEDVAGTEKHFSRIVRKEAEWEHDCSELSGQILKLAALEPGMKEVFKTFADRVAATGEAVHELRERVDTDYVVSLRDMEAYVASVKALLKQREQKQLDYEGLVEYHEKATVERNVLASGGGNGFLRSKVEDLRGVDHTLARVERLRKLDTRLEELAAEVATAETVTRSFDKEVARDLVDFERIKTLEVRQTLGALADDHIHFFRTVLDEWQAAIPQLED